jgi:hypothetical protein
MILITRPKGRLTATFHNNIWHAHIKLDPSLKRPNRTRQSLLFALQKELGQDKLGPIQEQLAVTIIQ